METLVQYQHTSKSHLSTSESNVPNNRSHSLQIQPSERMKRHSYCLVCQLLTPTFHTHAAECWGRWSASLPGLRGAPPNQRGHCPQSCSASGFVTFCFCSSFQQANHFWHISLDVVMSQRHKKLMFHCITSTNLYKLLQVILKNFAVMCYHFTSVKQETLQWANLKINSLNVAKGRISLSSSIDLKNTRQWTWPVLSSRQLRPTENCFLLTNTLMWIWIRLEESVHFKYRQWWLACTICL